MDEWFLSLIHLDSILFICFQFEFLSYNSCPRVRKLERQIWHIAEMNVSVKERSLRYLLKTVYTVSPLTKKMRFSVAVNLNFLSCVQLLTCLFLFISLSVPCIQAVCLRRGCALGSSSALMVSITIGRQYMLCSYSKSRTWFYLLRPVYLFLALDDLIVISGSSLDTAALLHPANATTQQETNAHSYIIYTAGTFTSFLISY